MEIDRQKKKKYIKDNVELLTYEGKKSVLSLVIREDGYGSITEFKQQKCVSIDLNKLVNITIIDRIYDIVKKRKDTIKIR